MIHFLRALLHFFFLSKFSFSVMEIFIGFFSYTVTQMNVGQLLSPLVSSFYPFVKLATPSCHYASYSFLDSFPFPAPQPFRGYQCFKPLILIMWAHFFLVELPHSTLVTSTIKCIFPISIKHKAVSIHLLFKKVCQLSIHQLQFKLLHHVTD